MLSTCMYMFSFSLYLSLSLSIYLYNDTNMFAYVDHKHSSRRVARRVPAQAAAGLPDLCYFTLYYIHIYIYIHI